MGGRAVSRARLGSHGFETAVVRDIDEGTDGIDVQAQGLGNALAEPALASQQQDARMTVAHNVIAALPKGECELFLCAQGTDFDGHSTDSLGLMAKN